jgi:hypothetical protein
MIPNKTPPQKTQHKTNASAGSVASARAGKQILMRKLAPATTNPTRKKSFSMLAITEGNETKHQQQAGCQDTTTQRDTAMRAPSQRLSARAMGAKER